MQMPIVNLEVIRRSRRPSEPVMFCCRCNARIPEDASFCPVCRLSVAGPNDVTQPSATTRNSDVPCKPSTPESQSRNVLHWGGVLCAIAAAVLAM
jgi:hypothetical protein